MFVLPVVLFVNNREASQMKKVIKLLYGLIVEIKNLPLYRRKGCSEELRFLNSKKRGIVSKMIIILFDI